VTVSTLDVIWSVEADPNLTDDEKLDAIAHLKASEWSDLTVPVTIGNITINSANARGRMVELDGEGGTLDWPLRLVNAPIGVLDPNGPDVDPWGQTWRVDCLAILAGILEPYQ